HVTVHFNGWGAGPNPENFTQAHIHAPIEGALVHDHVNEAMVLAAMPAYRDCKCDIATATAQYLRATNSEVVPLYSLEKKGGFKAKDKRGIEFVTTRLAAGAAELRDLIVSAWHESGRETIGYPLVPLADIENGKADAYDALIGTD